MVDINKIPVNQLISFIRSADDTTKKEIIENIDSLLQLDLTKLNIIYLNIDDQYKKLLLDNEKLFSRIMNIPINRMKKSIIDLSSDEIKNYIYNSKYLSNDEKAKKLLITHLSNLYHEDLEKLLNNDNLKTIYKLDIIDYLNNNFKLDEYLKVLILNNVETKKFNPLALLKIKNNLELLIYAKFGLLINSNNFNNEVNLDYDFIKNVNRKHIMSLIELIKNKEEVTDNFVLFVTVMKLYMIFGLDNSKKIINDFFTFATPASLKRVSLELFKENRREYRLKHQNKFYYHNIEIEFLDALKNNNYEFFKNFCSNTNDDYIKKLMNDTKNNIKYLSELDKLNYIKKVIDEEITKREAYFQKIDTNKFYKYYEQISKKDKLTLKEIYNVFSSVDIPYNLNKEGKLIINKDLNEFLLGNYKKDNDCLLRMVFNKHAFGLNRELYNIINHFEDIEELIKKNKSLSIHSISDVIDISKVFLYNLKPNEMDITLETLSKLLNSRKYCTEDAGVILDRIFRIHKKRKHKVACAIDKVKGSFEDCTYYSADFNSEDLLVSGIDTGSCFKVGGKGEDFFDFCLTSPKGIVFYIEYNNEKYVLPATINGNMLNINSIDPIIEEGDINTFNKIINTIKEIAKCVVGDSKNKIELVTITDIHLNKFLDNFNYEIINFEKAIPLNTNIYCDYNKKEVTNYIVFKKDKDILPAYFDNTDLFYQKRSVPYIFTPSHEHDKERISILINSIAYTNIDHLNITPQKKEQERYCYQNKDIDDYQYIVGNIDWFIGIKKDFSIDKFLLPYDDRALNEYQIHIDAIESVLKDNDQKKR